MVTVVAGSACCESTRAASGGWVVELTGRPTYTPVSFSAKRGLLKAGHQGRCWYLRKLPSKMAFGEGAAAACMRCEVCTGGCGRIMGPSDKAGKCECKGRCSGERLSPAPSRLG